MFLFEYLYKEKHLFNERIPPSTDNILEFILFFFRFFRYFIYLINWLLLFFSHTQYCLNTRQSHFYLCLALNLQTGVDLFSWRTGHLCWCNNETTLPVILTLKATLLLFLGISYLVLLIYYFSFHHHHHHH